MVAAAAGASGETGDWVSEVATEKRGLKKEKKRTSGQSAPGTRSLRSAAYFSAMALPAGSWIALQDLTMVSLTAAGMGT